MVYGDVKMPMQNFVSGLKNNQKGEEKMSRYEEILNSQFKMTDGGRVDYVKDLYTTCLLYTSPSPRD